MSTPINPKDFPSYEAYLDALKRHEAFQKRSEDVSGVVKNSKTDEAYQKGMEFLGFTCHEDEFCDRSYCQKNEICLWVALESFQSECNEYFFDGLLSSNDLIFTKEEVQNHFELGCKFTKSWDDEESLVYKSILFSLDLEEAIYNSRPSDAPFEAFVKHAEIKSAFRNLYLFLLIQLRQADSKKKSKVFNELEQFLKTNEILKKEVSKKFLKLFYELN